MLSRVFDVINRSKFTRYFRDLLFVFALSLFIHSQHFGCSIILFESVLFVQLLLLVSRCGIVFKNVLFSLKAV